jgi:hypothetical protein
VREIVQGQRVLIGGGLGGRINVGNQASEQENQRFFWYKTSFEEHPQILICQQQFGFLGVQFRVSSMSEEAKNNGQRQERRILV